ncbi:MAG TPA: putative metal-dependent hydrolase [Fibrobacteria bacterium]|nr:putative metal-dependent hydrolase [Fibrobacteria bacterium]
MDTIVPEIQRYPIGRFSRPDEYSTAAVNLAINAIDCLPRKLLSLVSNLTRADWERGYRPGSWTVHQVTNHIVDANVNNYTRFKFALTEDNPTIKPYLEDRWSELPDARTGDMRPATDLISAIHSKWVQTLKTMGEPEFRRTFHHPQMNRDVPLYEAVALYAWHGDHHLSQIRVALSR